MKSDNVIITGLLCLFATIVFLGSLQFVEMQRRREHECQMLELKNNAAARINQLNQEVIDNFDESESIPKRYFLR